MANVYVRSGAAGAGTGADWANAFTTLAAALTAKAAGDSFWVSEDHAETAASAKTFTSPGTAANPCFVYCVDHAGSVPPVSADLRTTATITTTGANSVSFATGYTYFYGITFSSGSGAVSSQLIVNGSNSTFTAVFSSCKLVAPGTNAAVNKLLFGSSAGGARQKILLNNTTVQFGSTGDSIAIRGCQFDWINTPTAIAGATLPTTLFTASTPLPSSINLEGVDLSAMGSGSTLVDVTGAPQKYVFKDCKLGASVTVATTPDDPGGNEVVLTRCDSGATNYRTEKYRYQGTQTVETTIVRTGGASDGTTTIAHKFVTTANSKWVLPFEAIPIAIWNDTSGSAVTVTVYGIWGGGAVPNNDDIWFDLEYLGASGNPQGSFATATKADNLATGSALTSDSSTWGGSTTKFKMAITVTPQQKGAMYIYVKAAKASTTFYIDPKPVLS